jgi:hypothetical protein
VNTTTTPRNDVNRKCNVDEVDLYIWEWPFRVVVVVAVVFDPRFIIILYSCFFFSMDKKRIGACSACFAFG